MHITLVLPRLDTMADGREQVRHISDNDIVQYDRKRWSTVFTERKEVGTDKPYTPPEEKRIHILPSKSITALTSDLFENPYEKIQRFFDQVPILELEQRDVPIEIPLIYDEDFTRYVFHLTSWLERNEAILEER